MSSSNSRCNLVRLRPTGIRGGGRGADFRTGLGFPQRKRARLLAPVVTSSLSWAPDWAGHPWPPPVLGHPGLGRNEQGRGYLRALACIIAVVDPDSNRPSMASVGMSPSRTHFCFHAPAVVWYHHPAWALSTHCLAKVARISSSHSGWPLATAISR